MAYEDPGWNRASAWLDGETENARCELQLIGVPLNWSITPGSCHLAPQAIRDVLFRFSTQSTLDFADIRQVAVTDHGDTLEPGAIQEALSKGASVLLGGDNSVTLLGVNALSVARGFDISRIGVVTLDAHFDVRRTDDGPTNGNPIRSLIECGLVGSNVVQIGIQSFANSPEYARYVTQQGIRQVSAEVCHSGAFDVTFESELERLAMKVDAIYFDLDLDVMDRAFAPGCPGSRPGGLMPFQVRQAARIAGSHPKVAVMDLVELDPTTDVNLCTTMTAAACLMEFASGVLSRE